MTLSPPSSPGLRIRGAVAADIPGIVRCGADFLAEDAGIRDRRVDPGWVLRGGREAFTATLGDPACLLLVAVAEEESAPGAVDGTDGGGVGGGARPDPAPGGGATVAGYAIGVLHEPVGVLPIRSAVLRALYVAPGHRGGGAGTRLTEEFFAWARAKDAVRAEVNAYAANESALRFYRRRGFTPRAVRLDLELDAPAGEAAPHVPVS
jgi:GNAT superfamily N-acetyltransferase